MKSAFIALFTCLVISLSGQDVPVYNSFDQLEKEWLSEKDDTTYVINFWATWCKPCVKELPYFEELYRTGKDDKISVKLISLDFPDQIESKLKPFLAKHKITAPVVLLNDGNANRWINKVDPEWSGALPVTLIYNREKRKAFEQTFDSTQEILEKLNQF